MKIDITLSPRDYDAVLFDLDGLLIAMGGFGERLNALQGGGVALILGAVALVRAVSP